MATFKNRIKQQATQAICNARIIKPNLRSKLLQKIGHSNISTPVSINPGSYFFGFGTTIGEGSFVNSQVYFDDSAPVTIGKNVGIGPRVTFLTGSHHIGPADHRISGGGNHLPIKVEDGCWIGGNSTILPGVTIGKGCVIAAGAVVVKDCLPNGLYAGVPAKRIKELPQ